MVRLKISLGYFGSSVWFYVSSLRTGKRVFGFLFVFSKGSKLYWRQSYFSCCLLEKVLISTTFFATEYFVETKKLVYCTNLG